MKKILISLVTLFCLSTMAMADVELASGSLSALKNAGEYAYVEIDWSKAKVVEFGRGDKVEKSFGTIDQYNKSQGADWVKDWPALKQDILNFTAWKKYPTRPCFNKKNKKGTLITVNPAVWKSKSSDKDHCIWENPSKAKYKFVLTVEQVDMGNGVASKSLIAKVSAISPSAHVSWMSSSERSSETYHHSSNSKKNRLPGRFFLHNSKKNCTFAR